MKEFRGKVAVVTGAASGIGRALAERSAKEGMKVVLADIEEPALERTAATLKAEGASVLAVPTDVSQHADAENLAARAFEAFGAVDLLFNNAGVGAGSAPWETSHADWQWVLGVNLWGVINGITSFVPRMISQGTEGHIVNTASIAGLLPFHPSATYQTTKFAVVGLSENLYGWLSVVKAKIKASVLCPGWVKTNILESERNRPLELRNPNEKPGTEAEAAMVEAMKGALEAGIAPESVAEAVFGAIREERFYILLGHEELVPSLRSRMENVLNMHNPDVQSELSAGGMNV